MSYRRDAWRFGRVPLTLTFQMEVAKRICSPIDDDARSRISIMAQYLTEPKILFTIPGWFGEIFLHRKFTCSVFFSPLLDWLSSNLCNFTQSFNCFTTFASFIRGLLRSTTGDWRRCSAVYSSDSAAYQCSFWGILENFLSMKLFSAILLQVVEKLCRQVFHYRQKYMIKGLKTLYPKEVGVLSWMRSFTNSSF